VHASKDHRWHMDTLTRLTSHGEPLMISTEYRIVDLTDPKSEAEATRWWGELTARGGESVELQIQGL
jgi:protein phosphatase